MLQNAIRKSIGNAGMGLAAAAMMLFAAGNTAHAQEVNMAEGLQPGGVSSSLVSGTDGVSEAKEVTSPSPQMQTDNGRRWGISVNQPTYTEGKGYLHTHGFDLAGSGTGRYVTPVTDQRPYLAGSTEGVGFLANIREHPVSWFGLELNYGYNRYTEHYRVTPAGGPLNRVQLDQHEATAGYVFHIKTPWVQPFLVVGGGGVNFRATRSNPQYGNQWRGAGMYELGFDLVPKRQPHVGFRIQEHGLFYKAPDFYVANFRSNSWIHQAMPSAGVFYRF